MSTKKRRSQAAKVNPSSSPSGSTGSPGNSGELTDSLEETLLTEDMDHTPAAADTRALRDVPDTPDAPETPATPDTLGVVSLLGDLEDRLSKLKQWQRESDVQIDQLRQQAEDVAHQRRELSQQRQQLEDDRQELDAGWSSVKDRQQQLEADAQLLADQRGQLEEQQSQLEQQHDAIEQEQLHLDQLRRELEQHEAELVKQHEAAEHELEKARQAVQAEHEELEQKKAELADLRKQVEKQKLDLKLRGQALEAQQQQLDRAREELVEQAGNAPLALEDDDAVEALREAEEQARAASEQRQEELTARRGELDHEQAGLAQREQSLAEQEASLSQREADLAERQATFQKLVRESKEQVAAEHEQVREKQLQLEAQAASLEGERQSFAERKRFLQEAYQAIEQRRARIRRYVDAARNRVESAATSSAPVAHQSASRLDAGIVAGLEKERQMLAEVKKFLESSEQEMLKRWATHKAVSLVATVIITMIALAGVSFAASQRLTKPLWQGSVVMAVQTSAAAQGSSADWLAKQRQALLSKPMLTETLNQMSRHGIGAFATSQQLGEDLGKHLHAAGSAEHFTLTYQSTHADVIVPLLEAVGRAYTGYTLAHRQTSADSVNPGSPVKITTPASRDQRPIKDERMKYAGILFGCLCGGALLVMLLLKLMLARSAKVLSEDKMPALTVLDKPDAWSPLPAAGREDA